MKKYYILAVTFLCLLCSQVSFGQGINEGGESDDYGQTYIDFWSELYGFEIVELGLVENGIPTSFTTSDGTVINLLNEVVITNNYHDPEPETTDNGNPDDTCPSGDCNGSDNGFPDDPCPSGDYNDCYGNGGGGGSGPPETEDYLQNWYLDYDGDGYHGSVAEASRSPGIKWKLYTSGLDCDDIKPQYTTVCCTTTCDSGYKLNPDTCECVELPPCFGTIKDFETSNSFNNSTILNKVNSFLGDFGISADVMDSIEQMNIFDPKTIANGTDLVKFADDLGVVGDGLQVVLDYSKYIDEPSTQNLLKTLLDVASTMLSPAASLALNTIDYFKDSDGNSKLDLLLKVASDAIDRSLDCNLGLGIRNWVY